MNQTIVGAYPQHGPIRWGNIKGSKGRLPCLSGINNSAPFSQLKPADYIDELVARKSLELMGLAPEVPARELPSAKVNDILGMDETNEGQHSQMCYHRRLLQREMQGGE